jgi:pyruvate formate lyase activating enzyme
MSTSDMDSLHEARFWKTEGDRAACFLCPHHCKIAEGKVGICGVRQNIGGKLYSLIYGRVSAVHVDPMEKKPLFHFMPGQPILSLGSVGCNLRCLHCQNYGISQASVKDHDLSQLTPEEVSNLALESSCHAVAFTYNEPTIWHEFTFDACKAAKEHDLSTVYVTNGFMEEAPLREIAPFLDAMNIDVKGFKEGFYHEVCKARLEPVLRTSKLAHELGLHIELTYLVIPKKNDSEEEMREFCKWVSSALSPNVPVHFTRFHPDYMMNDVPATPLKTMRLAHRIATEEGLMFPYLGNIGGEEGENTYCPKCKALIIRRQGFEVDILALREGKCTECGQELNIVQR